MKKITRTTLALVSTAGILLAATYTYRCTRCGLIQQYTNPGIYKCPSDGQVMVIKFNDQQSG